MEQEQKSKALPPIHRIRLPEVRNRSTLIRWLSALGYPVKEIAQVLNVRYQQVRNVLHTPPKRAAREDMPSLEFQTWDLVDDVQAILDAELERSLSAQRFDRKQRSKFIDIDNEEYSE